MKARLPKLPSYETMGAEIQRQKARANQAEAAWRELYIILRGKLVIQCHDGGHWLCMDCGKTTRRKTTVNVKADAKHTPDCILTRLKPPEKGDTQ